MFWQIHLLIFFDNNFWHYPLFADFILYFFPKISFGKTLLLHLLANYFRKLFAKKCKNINFQNYDAKMSTHPKNPGYDPVRDILKKTINEIQF